MSCMPKPAISFAGCGGNGLYQIGAVAALRKFAPHLLETDILGSSSGSLLGAALVGDISTEEMVRSTVQVANKVSGNVLGPITTGFDMNQAFKDVYEQMLPEDIAEKASGRLHLSITKLPFCSNMMINNFTSKADVIDAVLASCFIPWLSGWIPPTFRGNSCIDGFYSNNQPILSKDTITVTAFCGKTIGCTTICPADRDDRSKWLNIHIRQGPESSSHISLNNVIRTPNIGVPPATKTLLKICTEGYVDTIKYLTEKGLIKCAKCMAASSKKPNCGLCLYESSASSLPEEILKVFEEAIEKEDTKERDLSSYICKVPITMWQTVFRL